MVEEGASRKVEVPDGPNRFDFTLRNHYHVRCVEYGEISDVDMDEIPNLLERIHDTHGIEYLDYDISAVNSYMGEYMKQYSWAELTNGFLISQSEK